MPVIFISYRREDTAGHAGRLFDRLKEKFGKNQVFLDVVGIEAGVDFVESIDKAIGSCDVLLAVIGREWLSCRDKNGRRRLEDENDFIRAEISSALQRNVRVVPVLVEGAQMPTADELPEELTRLVRRQAVELRDNRWNADVEALLEALEQIDTARTVTGRPQVAVAPAIAGKLRPAILWGIGALVALTVAVGAGWFFQRSREARNASPRTDGTRQESGSDQRTITGVPDQEQGPTPDPRGKHSADDSPPVEEASIEESLPKLYLLSVGVNDYGHPGANRHSAVASAKAIAGLFAKQKGKAFSDVETVVLTESKATQANVLRALKSWARTATNNDFAIAFFSGRVGIYPTDNTPDRYAFMCFGSDYNEPELTGISGKVILDLSAKIAAPKLVIIDTPTYGGIHSQVARDATSSVEVQRLPALDILVASWNGEETESSFGQSSFSKTLLDGLNMAADANQDDVVTFIELWNYILAHGGSAGLTTPIQFRELNPQTVLMRSSP